MGFRCSFIVSKTEPDELLDALGISGAQENEDMPTDGRWCARINNSGWTVVFAYDLNLPYETQDTIALLSKKSMQYIGLLNETNMSISVSKYNGGKEEWAIDWFGEEGFKLQNLSARGNLPNKFELLKNDAIEAQALDKNVDYIFDIPILLIKEETDFRYDGWLEASDIDKFRILSKIIKDKPKKSFLSKFFGRDK